jgi:hypothetical protein
MKTKIVILIALALALAPPVFALYDVIEHGAWPKTWPPELEKLRDKARTYIGPEAQFEHHEISFTDRDEFESAWPHLLKVKSAGAPVILLRGPNTWLNKVEAGVRIHTPPGGVEGKPELERPLRGEANDPQHWMWTKYLELIVDGKIVDLNRIKLPENTPIIDRRFAEKK